MAARRKRPDGWWYPWIFVAGMGVVVAVNAVLVFFATTTYSGLETEGHYEKGLAYNETIERTRRMEAMGWSSDVAFETAPGGDGTAIAGRVVARLSDRDGRPLDGLRVRLVVSRPTRDGFDQDLTLAPAAAGTYAAGLDVPMKGQWDFRVVATGGEVPYQKRHRLVVP